MLNYFEKEHNDYFSTPTMDGDPACLEVRAKNRGWIGDIICYGVSNFKFQPSSKDCQFEADVLITIANKMKELEK